MSDTKFNEQQFEKWCSEADYRELLAVFLNEIHQPLGIASGFAGLLKYDFENGQPTEETASYVQPLNDSIDKMNEMVMAYLDCLKKKVGEPK